MNSAVKLVIFMSASLLIDPIVGPKNFKIPLCGEAGPSHQYLLDYEGPRRITPITSFERYKPWSLKEIKGSLESALVVLNIWPNNEKAYVKQVEEAAQLLGKVYHAYGARRGRHWWQDLTLKGDKYEFGLSVDRLNEINKTVDSLLIRFATKQDIRQALEIVSHNVSVLKSIMNLSFR